MCTYSEKDERYSCKIDSLLSIILYTFLSQARARFNYDQAQTERRDATFPSIAERVQSTAKVVGRLLGTVFLGYGARYGGIRRAVHGRVVAECRAWHERQHAISETPVSARRARPARL